MNMIKLEHIEKEYINGPNHICVLKDINVTINAGESVAIIGTSGSGKTTLLNILGLIDMPSKGEYFLDNKNISEYSKHEVAKMRNSSIGFVVQDFALIEYYNVEDNIKLPLMYSQVPKNQWDDKIELVLHDLKIQDKRRAKPFELSGGQRQRVAIARSLINNPGIILADEPTGALDSKTSKEILELLFSIKERERTVVIVTHDATVANYCDRIIQIEDGHIVSK